MFDTLFKRRSTGLDSQPFENEFQPDHAPLEELIGLRLYCRQFKFSSQQLSSNLLAGNHVSRFKGRGMDYQESRGYQQGDDIRNMDWRVTARTTQPHVKLFQEERERPVFILADFNPGMFFASQGRFKSVRVSQLAALLAWTAINNGDRVGGLLFNDQHHEIQPRGGKQGVLNFLHQLEQASRPHEQHHRDHDSQAFNNALHRLQHITRPGSLVFILSDFYAMDENSRSLLLRLKNKSEIVLLRILDALELEPPPANRYAISDGEQQFSLNTANVKQREQYLQWFQQQRQLVEFFSQSLSIALHSMTTNDDPVAVLKSLLEKKSASSRLWRHHR